MSDDDGFGVQVGIGIVGRIAMALVAFGGSIVLARVLGPNKFGVFYAILAIASIIDRPITGWSNACRKRLREVDFSRNAAVGATLLGVIFWSAITLAGAWIGAPWIASYSGRSEAWVLLSILVAGVGTFNATRDLLQATTRFGAGTWLMAGRDIARVALQILFVVGFGLGVVGMVTGMALGHLLLVPLALVLIGSRPRLPDRDHLHHIWSFARASVPRGLLSTGQDRIDIILLSFLAGSGVVGNYEVALKLTIPAMLVAGVASTGLIGQISDRRSRGKSVTANIQHNIGYASLFAMPLFAGSLVLARPVVVTVYSNEYAAAGGFLAGLALFRLIRSQKKILGAVVDGFDRPAFSLRVYAVVFLVNFLGGLVLFHWVGPIGVVYATVGSEFIAYLWLAAFVGSVEPEVSLVPRPLIEQFGCSVLMAVTVWSLRTVFGLPTWWAVFGYVGLGAVLYVVLLGTISVHARSTIRTVLSDANS
jgi:O-antigen/teichoic acid export membrane protein